MPNHSQILAWATARLAEARGVDEASEGGPPAPSTESTSYGPMRVPGDRANGGDYDPDVWNPSFDVPRCREDINSAGDTMKAKNTICLWFDKDAEAAARFYAATFPDSKVIAV
ncbi:MAG TPA: VOC family protein, partial [Pyrinomonadaceae bacterium]